MTLGFTGTECGDGMTQRQRATYRYLIRELDLRILHHGDCVGSDAQADADARRHGAEIVIHPPLDEKLRAFCDYSMPHQLRRARPYLKRNQDIINEGVDGLIATPGEDAEQLRSGTWATIRYARKAGRRIWIIWPDGTFKEEPAARLEI